MYGLAVNLIVSVSGHPWIIDEIINNDYYWYTFHSSDTLMRFVQVFLTQMIIDSIILY